MVSNNSLALSDFILAIQKYRLIHELGLNDIKQRYRRTVLGPIWISLSLAATILGLGILFGIIFKQKNSEYFPYLAVGILFWTFISTVISEGADSFIAMGNVMKQISLPYSIYVFRVMYRNIIILAHNLIIAIIIFYFLDIEILDFNFLVIPQVFLGIINLFWMMLVLAVITTRYRDINPIVTNGLQLFFYLSPIIWLPDQIKDNGLLNGILKYNPFYYILTALRSLMNGILMSQNQLLFLGIMAITGVIVSFMLFSINYKKITFWL
jgi:lipopolysaccharide transport system permease protein